MLQHVKTISNVTSIMYTTERFLFVMLKLQTPVIVQCNVAPIFFNLKLLTYPISKFLTHHRSDHIKDTFKYGSCVIVV